MTYELVLMVSAVLLAIGLTVSKASGRDWREVLEMNALLMSLVGSSGAMVLMSGLPAALVGFAALIPGVVAMTRRTPRLMFARTDRLAELASSRGEAPGETLLAAADAADLRERHAAMKRLVQRGVVMPGVVIGIAGLVLGSGLVMAVGAGSAALAALAGRMFVKWAVPTGDALTVPGSADGRERLVADEATGPERSTVPDSPPQPPS